jgi:Xaa-Pro aminopeptidase
VNDRVARLREQLDEPLLVTHPTNVLYLSGFESSNAMLLVEPERVRLFTDFRYLEAARALEGVEVTETRRDVIGNLGEILSGRIAFEARAMTYAQAQRLERAGLELLPTEQVVERLRAVKDEQELATLRRACAITDRVFERLSTEVPFVGRTERDVAWDIARLFHEEGAAAPAFESIVGSGPTGSRPHARAGDRTIGADELVVVDTGCTVDGYASDYTRTFATGSVDGDAREAYAVVLAAQQAALDAIHAGLAGLEADTIARRVVDESEFAGMFGHGLGHGLGLEVHELPRVSTETTDVLEPGNVITVEPGIYVSGRFGVRIEDDVVVTPDGVENLTGFSKDWIEVA